MAKYDRRILLPYLRNVYSIELLLQNQKAEFSKLRSKLTDLEDILSKSVPPKKITPPSPVTAILLGCISLVACCLTVIGGLLATVYEKLWSIVIASLLIAAVSFLQLIRKWCVYQKHSKRYRLYLQKVEDYNLHASERQRITQDIEDCRKEVAVRSEQISELMNLRHNLFNLNVIPVQYRTMSAFAYLFDYFLSSKADDIDTVIQSYAVEKMTDPSTHDDAFKIHSLLNQRARIADHVIGDLSHRQYYESQMQEIANQEANPDLRNQYIKMIHIDLSVSTYFFRNEQGRIAI